MTTTEYDAAIQAGLSFPQTFSNRYASMWLTSPSVMCSIVAGLLRQRLGITNNGSTVTWE